MDLKGFRQEETKLKMKVVVSFCVQVVEGVGLVVSGFQFFTCLPAVFTAR